MSGLLHPVGPEPARTYWWRRALVLAGVAAVVVVVALTGLGGGPRRAVPSARASTTPRVDATSAAAATARATHSPTARANHSRTARATHSPTARGSRSPSKRADAPASAKPTPSASPKRPASPVTCSPAQLHTSLTGPSRLTLAAPALFTVSVVNRTPQTCRLSVTADNFEVKVYSGRDRIWSSADCPTGDGPLRQELARQQTASWQLRWNGTRSAGGCKTRPQAPRAGTYIATAQLKGAQPAQLRMILHG